MFVRAYNTISLRIRGPPPDDESVASTGDDRWSCDDHAIAVMAHVIHRRPGAGGAGPHMNSTRWRGRIGHFLLRSRSPDESTCLHLEEVVGQRPSVRRTIVLSRMRQRREQCSAASS